MVCNTLGYGFIEEKFTIDQAKYLFDQIKKYELLFYKIDEIGIPTLTRSFTCLLLQLIMQENENQTSKYFRYLNQTQEKYICANLIRYLGSEQDYTGYSEKYGWIHAIAQMH